MTIDFDNEDQYRKFVKDVAASLFNYSDELIESIAGYVVDRIGINICPAL